MNPNEVKELLNALIQEFALPISTIGKGPLLIVENDGPAARAHTELIIKRWKGARIFEKFQQNIISGHWCLARGRPVSAIYNEIERLASDSIRIPEVKEVLRVLIKERELPFSILHLWFTVVIFPNKPRHYRTDEMIELENLLEQMTLEGRFENAANGIQVHHAGFTLQPKADTADVHFPKVQEIGHRLQSQIEKHELQVRLIHNGFKLEKEPGIEIDVAEAKELASRLMFMTGIDYCVGAYGMGPKEGVKPGWTNAINWKHARLSSARPW